MGEILPDCMMPDGADPCEGFTRLRADLTAALSRAEKAEGERDRMREALTPSGETKAEYIGEFSIPLPVADEEGEEYIRQINVPWTTVKEIMAAIRRRAALSTGEPAPRVEPGASRP